MKKWLGQKWFSSDEEIVTETEVDFVSSTNTIFSMAWNSLNIAERTVWNWKDEEEINKKNIASYIQASYKLRLVSDRMTNKMEILSKQKQ